MTLNERKALQRELLGLFAKYDLSVVIGVTAQGVFIGSQDKRLDAQNLGDVVAYQV